MRPPTQRTIPLGEGHALRALRLPDALRPDFEELWRRHPEAFHEIVMAGRRVETPRWQQAYGADYRYTGRVNRALPVPPILAPLLAWTRAEVDARLNGVLLNWYAPEKGHYIGKHRDSTIGMVEGAPIVTISLGAERVFRLRPWRKSAPRIDVPVADGTVLVMSYATNLAWTHEVPFRPSLDSGRRISVTLRAFAEGPAHPERGPEGPESKDERPPSLGCRKPQRYVARSFDSRLTPLAQDERGV